MKRKLKKSRKQGKGKSNLRSRSKYANVKPHLNLKTRADEISDVMSYFNTLSEKDKRWMDRFCAEWIGASFKKDGRDKHKSARLRRDCYSRNNSRNRDILTRTKAQGLISSYEEMKENTDDPTDKLIDELDKKYSSGD